MSSVDLSLSGLASGFDWKSLVDQLTQAERGPQTALRKEQNTLQQRNLAYGSIKTELGVLQTSINALKDANLYASRASQVSNTTIASAMVTANAALGSYAFNITQLATASRQNGTSDAGRALSTSSDVSGLTLTNAGFPTPVSAGVFTVNGQQVTVAADDTLQGVFDKIATATGNNVTATYDPTADKINLSSTGGEIVLGSATDTSNFLQVAKLNNNGTNSIASASALGGVRLTGMLDSANLATAISAGAGSFKINGVSIAYDPAADSVANVVQRINDSGAGVSASYDSLNDRFVLASKSTGDMGIALQDVTGNFLAATGLAAGTLTRGKNLLYSVDGGPQLTSQSNTITEASSGIAGLSLTALQAGTTNVAVTSDTAKINTAITGFISAYNRVQSVIDTQTASSTDAQGVVTAGILASDGDADDLASSMRTAVYSTVTGLSGTLSHLASLGISTNGKDNTLTLDDPAKLDSALTSSLADVKALFSDATNGIAVKVSAFLDRTIGDNGSLVTKQTNLTKQSSAIDTQVADLEKLVQSDRQRMVEQFTAMETAQATLNQQLQYLTRQFG